MTLECCIADGVPAMTCGASKKQIVYFVDDSEDMRTLASLFFNRAGFEVVTEASTTKAREYLAEGTPPAIAVVDYHNPGDVTGDEVVRGIPAEVRRNMVVIGISGEHFTEQENIYCVRYQKPFEWNEVVKEATRLAAIKGASNRATPYSTVIGCNK